MLRHNHYEVAFEEYLRQRRMPYVAVDESRRACWEEGSLKSLDFIVYSQRQPNLLVDVKGRRWGGPTGTHSWENWANTDDIESLRHWQDVFGPGFRAVLIFAYDLVSPAARERFPDRFSLGGRDYAFYCVGVDEYAEGMRQRSRGWQTVSLPRAQYRHLRTPLEQVL